MQREIGSPTVGSAALELPTKVRPDLNPLVNKADLSMQRAQIALETYVAAPPGSPRRELYERVAMGENVDRVVDSLQARNGLVIPAEDRSYLKEYQQRSMLAAPRIELGHSVYAQVASPALDRSPGVHATPEAANAAVMAKLTPGQLEAVRRYAEEVNTGLTKTAAALGEMKAKGLEGTEDYRKAQALHKELLHSVEPTPAMMGMAQARENAKTSLEAQAMRPEVKRVSAALLDHYADLAHGETLPESARAYQLMSNAALEREIAARTEHLSAAGPSGPESLAHKEELDRLKAEQARRSEANKPSGMPRATVGGYFAGMERPEDLRLSRDAIVERALLAEVGPGNPHDPLQHELLIQVRKSPPAPAPGLDGEALRAMYDARQQALAAHREALRAPLQGCPQAGPTLESRNLGLAATHPALPPFAGDGPADPAFIPPRGSGLPPSGGSPSSGDPGMPPSGGGANPPEGPGGIVPPRSGGNLPPAPPVGSGSGPDPVNRFRPSVHSPESHGAAELLKQIQEAEELSRKETRREALFTALSVGGAGLTAVVAISAEIAAAPMNPHSDPGKALGHAATFVNTSSMSVGQHLRQKVHQREKADKDIKAVVDIYSREQRAHAEEWAEKMSNQMDHLDHLVPPPDRLDHLERVVAAQIQSAPGFKDAYETNRDINAYEIHMAAANEMIWSTNPELRETGQRVAAYLRSDSKLEAEGWKSLQDRIANLRNDPAFEAGGGKISQGAGTLQDGSLQLGTYETYLRSLEHQHYTHYMQAAVRERIRESVDSGQLGALLGDEARVNALLHPKQERDPEFPDTRTPEARLMDALNEKHKIERSIQAGWRDFVARTPVHADRVVHAGMHPDAMLNAIYKRTPPDTTTPDREAITGLREYFQRECEFQSGRGNMAELREKLGIPPGWGDSTVSGSKVGIAPCQNGSVQALLIGYKHDSNEMNAAVVHLFTREGVTVTPAALQAEGILDVDKFMKGRDVIPPPHMNVTIDGEDVKKLPVDRLSSHVANTYNAALLDAYTEHAEKQLQADSLAFAGMKLHGVPLTSRDAITDVSATLALAKEFQERNRSAYLSRGQVLASRESIQPANARAMATQLKEAQTMGGFSQVIEASRGHFKYPPHRAALDREPRVALEGKNGDRVGRDFQRAMNMGDNAFLAIPNEIKVARQKGVNFVKDPQALYQMSPKVAQTMALLDTPIQQSHMVAASRDSYNAALKFLDRKGYGSNARP